MTALKIFKGGIPAAALDVESKNAYDEDFPIYAAQEGFRHCLAMLGTAAGHEYVDFDLGSAISQSCNALLIGHADYFQAQSVNVLGWRGCDQARDIVAYIPSLTCWLNETNVTSSAGLVSSWNDISGNGNHFTQSTAGYKPVLSRADNGENRAPYSEAFDNAAHTKLRATITANAIANPLDGAETADKLVDDATAGNTHKVYHTFTTTAGQIYRYSVYGKYQARDIGLYFDTAGFSNTPQAYFNLQTCAVTSSADATATVESLAGGWCRATITATADASAVTTAQILLALEGTNTITYDGDGSSGAYIFGLQLQTSSASPTYIPTTTYPQYRGVNGLPAVVFDGVNDKLASAATLIDFFAADGKTVFLVLKPFAQTGNRIALWSTGNHFTVSINYNASGDKFFSANRDSGGLDITAGLTPTVNTCQIHTLTHDGSNLTHAINNGSPISVASGATATTNTAMLFSDGTYPYSGAALEIITFNRVLSAAEQAWVYEYLAAKWIRPPSVLSLDFLAETLIGRRSNDYITTFTTSTAYRHWWLDAISDTSTSKFPRCHNYAGCLFDMGIDPSDYDYQLAQQNDTSITFSTGNKLLIKASNQERLVFMVKWVLVSDTKAQEFAEEFLHDPKFGTVYLYTGDNGNDQILADYQLVCCRVLSEQCEIRSGVKANQNEVTAYFEEVLG